MSVSEVVKDSTTLVIAFTGFANKLNLPVPKFFAAAGLDSVSRIVVCDPSKRKTLGGLPPELPTFFDVLRHLKSRIEAIAPEEVIITGTSGGAHSALLYGHLLGADKVVAFAPYPYLTIRTANAMGDPALQSMHRVLELFDQLQGPERQFLDLNEVLCHWNGKTQYCIHVAQHNEWDRRRAMYLQHCPNVSIVEHPCSEHSIADVLSQQGKLSECFSRAFHEVE